MLVYCMIDLWIVSPGALIKDMNAIRRYISLEVWHMSKDYQAREMNVIEVMKELRNKWIFYEFGTSC